MAARTHAEVEVLLRPSQEDLSKLGVTLTETINGPAAVRFPRAAGTSWGDARTLHAVDVYRPSGDHDIAATDDAGRACWLVIRDAGRIVIVVGTDIAGDLCRYRQGDPARVASRQTEAMWGIPGERPFYLFDAQQPEGSESDRQADWWGMALAETVAGARGQSLPPLLPHGAPGAVVVTGDDDQAYLEKYREQLDALGGVPITYFLHPLTRHTPQTIDAMRATNRIELGLHPDALDAPESYAEKFREQASWFERSFGTRAELVRNHGFLNDGYWGHLPSWIAGGVRASSNLPGVNGRVLNGSLLPSRVAFGDQLSSHWSILTAIGDGIRFALGYDGPQSARCISDLAERIEQSRLPGVIVLNLHPQNIAETREMHAAIHALIARGFVTMTLGECIDWFDARDRAA